MKLIRILREFSREETGQDTLEYAMVLVAVLAAVSAGSDPLAKAISHEMKRLMTDIKTLHIA